MIEFKQMCKLNELYNKNSVDSNRYHHVETNSTFSDPNCRKFSNTNDCLREISNYFRNYKTARNKSFYVDYGTPFTRANYGDLQIRILNLGTVPHYSYSPKALALKEIEGFTAILSFWEDYRHPRAWSNFDINVIFASVNFNPIYTDLSGREMFNLYNNVLKIIYDNQDNPITLKVNYDSYDKLLTFSAHVHCDIALEYCDVDTPLNLIIEAANCATKWHDFLKSDLNRLFRLK